MRKYEAQESQSCWAQHSVLLPEYTGGIGGVYASTYLHRLALKSGFPVLELDVLNATAPSFYRVDELVEFLKELRTQFIELLRKEGLPLTAVSTYKLLIELVGNRPDVVDIRCGPVIIDLNGKEHKCAIFSVKYPEPI